MVKMFNFFDVCKGERIVKALFPALKYQKFCNQVGIRYSEPDYYESYFSLVVKTLEKRQNSLERFIAYYVVFVNCLDENSEADYDRNFFKDVICQQLEEAHIPFDLLKDDDGYFIFPKGAKELDDALVSEPLVWLKKYPGARKTYITALKQYSDGIYIRDVADNLRKALETFLQEFLGNIKNLETNKNDICKYLGEQGVDAGVGGLFQPLINSYKNINDRIAKHNDAVDARLLEFLLYQTGVLIRMVIKTRGDRDEET